MKAKKIVALLMAATMVASLTACGNSGTTPSTDSSTDNAADNNNAADQSDAANDADDDDDGEDVEDLLADVIPEQTVTLDVFDQLANYSGEQIGWFGQIMLEKFNVKLNIIPDEDGVY